MYTEWLGGVYSTSFPKHNTHHHRHNHHQLCYGERKKTKGKMEGCFSVSQSGVWWRLLTIAISCIPLYL